MDQIRTSAAVQQYLDELGGILGDSSSEPVVSALVGRAVCRLHLLCMTVLNRSYRRLTRPPMNLQAQELLSSVVTRLLKALRETRPQNARGFFSLANQHMIWEQNGLARRLDKQAATVEINEELLLAPGSSASDITPNTCRMLQAIDDLPAEEREVFSLVRIQGMTHGEVAELVGVSVKTVQRRLNRSLLLLWDMLPDLHPDESPTGKP